MSHYFYYLLLNVNFIWGASINNEIGSGLVRVLTIYFYSINGGLISTNII